MKLRADINPVMLTFMEHILCDAIIMALYINGAKRPTFMDEHIEHTRRTFGVSLDRWEPGEESMRQGAESEERYSYPVGG